MNLSTGVKNFIEENIELIEAEDFKTLEDKASRRISDGGYDKAAMYEVLLDAGINPLPYLNEVPYAVLRGTFIEGTFKIPGNCKYIGTRAFWECALNEVIIEEGVEDIGALVFARSKDLRFIHLPRSIKSIDNGICTGCENLEEIIYNGSYEEFKQITLAGSHVDNKNWWFGPITTLAQTSCILKCKDQDIRLRIDI